MRDRVAAIRNSRRVPADVDVRCHDLQVAPVTLCRMGVKCRGGAHAADQSPDRVDAKLRDECAIPPDADRLGRRHRAPRDAGHVQGADQRVVETSRAGELRVAFRDVRAKHRIAASTAVAERIDAVPVRALCAAQNRSDDPSRAVRDERHVVQIRVGMQVGAGGMRALLEGVLEPALEDGTVVDAVLADSDGQRQALWRLREEHAEAQKRAGASIKNDVSVPPSRVPALIAEATAACEALMPGIRVVPFGHAGDGNIHFNLLQPESMATEAFLARAPEVMACVNGVVHGLDGSFSAEHGVGRLKPYLMEQWRGGAELDVMRRIKDALDPQGVMNPQALFSKRQ